MEEKLNTNYKSIKIPQEIQENYNQANYNQKMNLIEQELQNFDKDEYFIISAFLQDADNMQYIKNITSLEKNNPDDQMFFFLKNLILLKENNFQLTKKNTKGVLESNQIFQNLNDHHKIHLMEFFFKINYNEFEYNIFFQLSDEILSIEKDKKLKKEEFEKEESKYKIIDIISKIKNEKKHYILMLFIKKMLAEKDKYLNRLHFESLNIECKTELMNWVLLEENKELINGDLRILDSESKLILITFMLQEEEGENRTKAFDLIDKNFESLGDKGKVNLITFMLQEEEGENRTKAFDLIDKNFESLGDKGKVNLINFLIRVGDEKKASDLIDDLFFQELDAYWQLELIELIDDKKYIESPVLKKLISIVNPLNDLLKLDIISNILEKSNDDSIFIQQLFELSDDRFKFEIIQLIAIEERFCKNYSTLILKYSKLFIKKNKEFKESLAFKALKTYPTNIENEIFFNLFKYCFQALDLDLRKQLMNIYEYLDCESKEIDNFIANHLKNADEELFTFCSKKHRLGNLIYELFHTLDDKYKIIFIKNCDVNQINACSDELLKNANDEVKLEIITKMVHGHIAINKTKAITLAKDLDKKYQDQLIQNFIKYEDFDDRLYLVIIQIIQTKDVKDDNLTDVKSEILKYIFKRRNNLANGDRKKIEEGQIINSLLRSFDNLDNQSKENLIKCCLVNGINVSNFSFYFNKLEPLCQLPLLNRTEEIELSTFDAIICNLINEFSADVENFNEHTQESIINFMITKDKKGTIFKWHDLDFKNLSKTGCEKIIDSMVKENYTLRISNVLEECFNCLTQKALESITNFVIQNEYEVQIQKLLTNFTSLNQASKARIIDWIIKKQLSSEITNIIQDGHFIALDRDSQVKIIDAIFDQAADKQNVSSNALNLIHKKKIVDAINLYFKSKPENINTNLLEWILGHKTEEFLNLIRINFSYIKTTEEKVFFIKKMILTSQDLKEKELFSRKTLMLDLIEKNFDNFKISSQIDIIQSISQIENFINTFELIKKCLNNSNKQNAKDFEGDKLIEDFVKWMVNWMVNISDQEFEKSLDLILQINNLKHESKKSILQIIFEGRREIGLKLIQKHFKYIDSERQVRLIKWMLLGPPDDRNKALELIDKHFGQVKESKWQVNLIIWMLERPKDREEALDLIDRHFELIESEWKVKLINSMLVRIFEGRGEIGLKLIQKHFKYIENAWQVIFIKWMLQRPDDRNKALELIDKHFGELKENEWQVTLINRMLERPGDRGKALELIDKHFGELKENEWQVTLIKWMLQRPDDRNKALELIDKHFGELKENEWQVKLIKWMLVRPPDDRNKALELIDKHFVKFTDREWKANLINSMLLGPPDDRNKALELIDKHFGELKENEWQANLINSMLLGPPDDRNKALELIDKHFGELKKNEWQVTLIKWMLLGPPDDRNKALELIDKHFGELKKNEWQVTLINRMLERPGDRGKALELIDKHFGELKKNEWQVTLIKWMLQRPDDRNKALELIDKHFGQVKESKWQVNLIIWMLQRPDDRDKALELIIAHFKNINSEWQVKLIIYMLKEYAQYTLPLIKEYFKTCNDKNKEDLIIKMQELNFLYFNTLSEEMIKTEDLTPYGYSLILRNKKFIGLQQISNAIKTLFPNQNIQNQENSEQVLQIELRKTKAILSVLLYGTLNEENYQEFLKKNYEMLFENKNPKIEEQVLIALKEFEKKLQNENFAYGVNNLKYLSEKLDLKWEKYFEQFISLSDVLSIVNERKKTDEDVLKEIEKQIKNGTIEDKFKEHFNFIRTIRSVSALSEDKDNKLIEVIKYLETDIKNSTDYNKCNETNKQTIDNFFVNLCCKQESTFRKGKVFRASLIRFLESVLIKLVFEPDKARTIFVLTSSMNNCGAGKAQMAIANNIFNGSGHENAILSHLNENLLTAVSELTMYYKYTDLNHVVDEKGQNNIAVTQEFKTTYLNMNAFIKSVIIQQYSVFEENGLCTWNFIQDIDQNINIQEEIDVNKMYSLKIKGFFIKTVQEIEKFRIDRKNYQLFVAGTKQCNTKEEQEEWEQTEKELEKFNTIKTEDMIEVLKCFFNYSFKTSIKVDHKMQKIMNDIFSEMNKVLQSTEEKKEKKQDKEEKEEIKNKSDNKNSDFYSNKLQEIEIPENQMMVRRG